MCRFLALTACFLLTSGCTHIPLRNNTANEARALGEVYQQQVLNNLAMFAYDPGSLPHFSYANQGSSTISDSGSAGFAAGWTRFTSGLMPFLFSSAGLNLSGTRQAGEGFTLTPVNDPRRLELMRCAYQKAVSGCNGVPASENCPDCQTRTKLFYTGDPDGDIAAKSKGITTSECISTNCWLCVGCKKDIPKDCPCQLVGEYCGTYVWVHPQRRDELSKLTLTILDFAINSAPSEAQKTVYYFIDENGVPTTSSTAVGMVTASISTSDRPESLLNLPRADEVSLRDALQKELDGVNAKIAESQRKGWTTTLENLFAQQRLLQQKLNYLETQLRVGGLKENFRGGPSSGTLTPAGGFGLSPSGPLSPAGPGASGVLFINQTLNTLNGVLPPQ